MNPTLVTLGIQAVVRLTRAGTDAYAQHARDREVLLPMVNKIAVGPQQAVLDFFELNPGRIRPEALGYWESFRGKAPHLAGDADVMAAEYVRSMAEDNQAADGLADEAAGFWIVAQWGKNAGVGPFGRVIVTMADVALEFAAHDPSLFGIQGRAEPIIKALAANLADLIPDDASDLGAKNLLGERFAGIFLRGALKSLVEHPDALIEEEHLRVLVKNTLPKLLEALPDGLDLPARRDVVEALLGPVASMAVAAIAENQAAFFGHQFKDDEPLGALTRTFLLKVANIGLGEAFTRAGAIELYRSALGLAQARPELFIGSPSNNAEKLVAALFANLAATLEASDPYFNHGTITRLLATAVDTVGKNAGSLLDPGNPWEQVFGQALAPVLAALAESLQTSNTGALKRLVSGAGLTEFVRIILAQASKTPGMIVEDSSPEVKRIVVTIAGAMAKDENLLLSGDDWLAIVAVAVEEAAANPDRLFGLTAPATDVAGFVIGGLLGAATAQWKLEGRSGRGVLFGATLREAIIVALRTTAGNAGAAGSSAKALEQLAPKLNEVVAANVGRYGSKEWLRAYRVLIAEVLRTQTLPKIDADTIESILIGRS